ncbi:NAD(P)H-dependent oxidoreductase [Paenibacillus turicensis]|uniref:NAD(P)H-dependent oxidoreductase n=1 Tax=Paenibacillus turicensis TaxID=160487 RepID=UPI003D2B793D
MRTLVILAHPHFEQSRLNSRVVNELQGKEDVTIHNLYEAYPNEQLDVAREQALVEAHDRIVFQFPFYWYSSPPLLKKWIDEVIVYGWAYGSPEAVALRGKELLISITTGSVKENYTPEGRNKFTIEELLRPYEATSNLIEMKLLPHNVLYGASVITDEELEVAVKPYVGKIISI